MGYEDLPHTEVIISHEAKLKFADVNSKHSSVKIIVFGVLQGSLLGPRLFSIHANDLPDFVSKGYLFMFADDTTLYCVGKDIKGD